MGYAKWEDFTFAIERAVESCRRGNRDPERHFLPIIGKIELSEEGVFLDVQKKSGRGRPKEDMILSRFACYMVAMNGDPRKEEIAFAQAYFALQTRKMEILQEKVLEVDPGLNPIPFG